MDALWQSLWDLIIKPCWNKEPSLRPVPTKILADFISESTGSPRVEVKVDLKEINSWRGMSRINLATANRQYEWGWVGGGVIWAYILILCFCLFALNCATGWIKIFLRSIVIKNRLETLVNGAAQIQTSFCEGLDLHKALFSFFSLSFSFSSLPQTPLS